MKHVTAGLALIAIAAGCTASVREELDASAARKTPRNIIIFVGDGMGFKHIEAANLWQHGVPAGKQPYEAFPVKLGMSTFADGGSYDTEKTWADFNQAKSGPTDSAAAATALATGRKTYNSAIGVDPAKKPLTNILQLGESTGKATGVVSTVPISHATPAGFVAHNANRGSYAEIATEMFEKSEVDVIFGAGNPLFDDNGSLKSDGFDYNFVGGEAEWKLLTAGTAGANVDADHNGALDDSWKLIQERAEFQSLMAGNPPYKRVAGIIQAAQTTQQRRPGVDDNKRDDLPGAAPLVQSVPTLEEMTRAALNVLDGDPQGFYLMIEGGAIDWAGHSNEKGRLIEEQMDLNAAVQAAVAWVDKNSSWNETLVIVTADHETGYVTAGEGTSADQPIGNNGAGQMPGMAFNSGGHTNSLVPFYAKGPGAELVHDAAKGTDSRRGPYIDNTDIVRVLQPLIIPAAKQAP